MKVVVVASGDLVGGDASLLDGADLVIAADGGAGALDRLGRRPDVLVGDLDSIDAALVERLGASGTRVERHPADKDASDTELALESAIRAGASEIVLLGVTGGTRLDHELANLLLLAEPELGGRDVRIVHGTSTVRAVRGGETLELAATTGDLVSLLPVGGDAAGVVTRGLRWALEGATLRIGRSRGLSNEVTAASASVRLERGTLLVIHTASSRGAPA